MTGLKGLALTVALLVGATSLAMAQAQGSGGPDGQRTDGAADNPASASRGARHHRTKDYKMYMMSVNRTHKGSKLTPASNAKPLSEWLHRP
jgi:hypothetical protein